MKNSLKLLLLLATLAFGKSAFPELVTENIAKTVAFNFIKTVDNLVNSSSFSLVYTGKSEAQLLYYVFGNETGFVIVAADDRIEPILGYANEGRPFIVPEQGDTITGNNFWG
ncbi:MAG: Spi family protease inhibitor, partial [Bacteroidetes bacterium]|nr:Spi family protease inhibitor [Bacteroidota bacterium]